MSISRAHAFALAFLVVFTIISVLVMTGVSTGWDVGVLQSIASLRTPALNTMMQGVTVLGNWRAEVSLLFLVAALLWWRGRGSTAWRFLVLALSCELLYLLAKVLFHRTRPTEVARLVRAGWYSYPSGHAMLAPVIWGFGLVLLSQLVDSRAIRIALRTVGIAVPLAIAFSRVYLGVHYATDVLAGLSLGTCWVWIWRPWLAEPAAAAAIG
jgi:undecaprenyl-diphosphatase